MSSLIYTAALKAIYLIEIEARQPGGVAVAGRTDYGDLVYGEAIESDTVPSGTVIFRYASEAFVSMPDDSPANTPYQPRLAIPLSLSRQVAPAPGQSGIVTMSLGAVELLNDDGALDNLVRNYATDGRAVTIRKVDRGTAYATAAVLFVGTAAGWGFASRNKVTLKLRGQVHRLSVPLQTNLYAGSGGAEGGDDVKGKPKPKGWGKPRNVTPVPVAPATVTYQVNDGPIQAVDAVYDGGVALTFNADYANFALLVAASTPAGQYDTCLAAGYVQCGSPAVYAHTVDFQGDKTGGTFRTDTAAIVLHWLEDLLGIAAGDIDTAAFAALSALQPAVCDYYVTEPIAAADAIAEFMAGIGAWLGETSGGLFTCRRVDAPTGSTAGELTDATLVDAGFADLPENVSPAIWRIGVEWGRNWTVQANGLDGAAIAAAHRSFIAQEARVEYSADAGLLSEHPLAIDHAPVRGFFNVQADAAAEAARLQALWGQQRFAYLLSTKATGLAAELGDEVLLSSSRYGLGSGVPMVIYGHDFEAATNELHLSVFA